MRKDLGDIEHQIHNFVKVIYDDDLTTEDKKYIDLKSTFVEFIEIPEEESLPEDKNLVLVRVNIIGTVASYRSSSVRAWKQHDALEKMSKKFVAVMKGSELKFSNGDKATFKFDPNLVHEEKVEADYCNLEYWNGWAECNGDKLPDMSIIGLQMRIKSVQTAYDCLTK